MGHEARLILFISYLLGEGVFLRALGYIAQSPSQGALITGLLGVYLVLLTIEQLGSFRAPWQHHLYFTIQTILLATLLLLPPGYDFYAVLFFPLSTQALLNLPAPRAGPLDWSLSPGVDYSVLASGLSRLAVPLFFAVGAIFSRPLASCSRCRRWRRIGS